MKKIEKKTKLPEQIESFSVKYMPFYVYRCANTHETEVFAPISQHTDTVQCCICKETADQVFYPPGVNGGQMSDKTRDLLSAPFGRKRARNFKTVKDVDNALAEFKKKYPDLAGEPGRSDADRA